MTSVQHRHPSSGITPLGRMVGILVGAGVFLAPITGTMVVLVLLSVRSAVAGSDLLARPAATIAPALAMAVIAAGSAFAGWRTTQRYWRRCETSAGSAQVGGHAALRDEAR